ncbi:MAG: hypothetical protein K2X99_10025 [Gemmatimonadaceae bacterium]|nr:hypothetical protein [Gemmatimonadaceae bacterium]
MLEIAPPATARDALIAAWRAHVLALSADLGWPLPALNARAHRTGVTLAMTAPLDQLLTATEVNEWAVLRAWQQCGLPLALAPAAPGYISYARRRTATMLRLLASSAAQPASQSLAAAAAARSLPCLIDDEQLTIGAGRGGRSWPIDALPRPDAVPWDALHDIPTALITGSNGKTTTVRLVAALGAATGVTTGHCCTDGIVVAGETVDGGDYSGPAGARGVLRDPRVGFAVLETARGGMLRRGLAAPRARVAALLNVSADHFGEWGIHDLGGIADAKLTVAKAVGPDGMVVLNADDPVVAARAQALSVPLGWFALDDGHPRLVAHRSQGGATCGIDKDGEVVLTTARGERHRLGPVDEMPLTVSGSARYNCANIVAAVLIASGLGVPPDGMAAVLTRFGAARTDNPGRLERWTLGGVTVLMDYAHNPDGLEGLLAVAQHDRVERLALALGQAGNREDDAILALGAVAARAKPELVVLKDPASFLRGRTPGEVPALLARGLVAGGVAPERIRTILDETDAVRAAIQWAQPGDVVVLPVHAMAARRRVAEWLDALQARDWRPGDPC